MSTGYSTPALELLSLPSVLLQLFHPKRPRGRYLDQVSFYDTAADAEFIHSAIMERLNSENIVGHHGIQKFAVSRTFGSMTGKGIECKLGRKLRVLTPEDFEADLKFQISDNVPETHVYIGHQGIHSLCSMFRFLEKHSGLEGCAVHAAARGDTDSEPVVCASTGSAAVLSVSDTPVPVPPISVPSVSVPVADLFIPGSMPKSVAARCEPSIISGSLPLREPKVKIGNLRESSISGSIPVPLDSAAIGSVAVADAQVSAVQVETPISRPLYPVMTVGIALPSLPLRSTFPSVLLAILDRDQAPRNGVGHLSQWRSSQIPWLGNMLLLLLAESSLRSVALR